MIHVQLLSKKLIKEALQWLWITTFPRNGKHYYQWHGKLEAEELILKYCMQELKSFLLKQKYPKQIINHGLEKAMAS